MNHAPRIHVIAPAGECDRFIAALGLGCAQELIELVQRCVGDRFHVTGRPELFTAVEDEHWGGRRDDMQRAVDIEEALADDDVSAIVALRGGAWFTRILSRIDPSRMSRRTSTLTVFGFSELTPLVNIIAHAAMGRGMYDMGPAFLPYGMRRFAALELQYPIEPADGPAAQWAAHRLGEEFRKFWIDVEAILQGRPSSRRLCATVPNRWAHHAPPDEFTARFIGGNLCVMATMIASPVYRRMLEPAGRWIVLEDLREKPERIDRFLSSFTLSGMWNSCGGVLLGDFHRDQEPLTNAVCELLPFHLPSDRRIPVLSTRQVGHIWPMAPLPINKPLRVQKTANGEYEIGEPADRSV